MHFTSRYGQQQLEDAEGSEPDKDGVGLLEEVTPAAARHANDNNYCDETRMIRD
jgi:hypothetical protein